jgi:hypothetical protein
LRGEIEEERVSCFGAREMGKQQRENKNVLWIRVWITYE